MTHKLLRALKVPKPKPQEPDNLDSHMTQAIKAAVAPEVQAQVREQLDALNLPAQVAQRVQQTATEQLGAMARKHAAAAHDEVSGMLRKLEAQPAPQAPMADADLDIRIRRHVSDQLERQRPMVDPGEPMAPVWQPQPVPQAKPAMPIITMTRGADGRIKAAHVGRMTLLVERSADGRAQRLVPQED